MKARATLLISKQTFIQEILPKIKSDIAQMTDAQMTDGAICQKDIVILMVFIPKNEVLKLHEKERPNRNDCPFIEVFSVIFWLDETPYVANFSERVLMYSIY